MALTPEEVINKRFQATKFKEGYNPEEVDDFLDEIVIELRRLNAENSSLKCQLDDAEVRAAQAEATSVSTFSDDDFIVADEPAAEEVHAVEEGPAQEAPEAASAGTSSAAALLAMAQKVHDDYVLEGQREKDRLLAEGREEASSLLTSAQEERAQVLGDLDATKSSLESSVAQLRQFEQQYRSGLRAYLEDQLVGLESTPLVESEIVQHNN
ncbi:DivIVA domain-containing protein [Rothia amarae]|uniref:DivIVA domain-containing protein n=1 Tax=Rothia amarae TaxID=169480 RepID=UPI0033DCC815